MSIIYDIKAWEIFRAVSKTGSLSIAASNCDVTISTASRKLTLLEEAFGERLFVRESRPIGLTPAAVELLGCVDDLLRASQRLQSHMHENDEGDVGTIRFMLPSTIGEFSAALLSEYSRFAPKVRFELQIPIDVDAFRNEGADVLLLTGEPQNPMGLVTIPRGTMYFLGLASPAWVKRYGFVELPDQLPQCSIMTMPWHPAGVTTELMKAGETVAISKERLTVCTNARAIKAAALDGYALALDLPFFYCVEEILQGRLVPVLNGWHRKSQPNYVVCSAQSWKLSRCRKFAHWIARVLENQFAACGDRLRKAGVFLE